MELDLARKRILIFVVAYNAEKTLTSVLDRIPRSLHQPNVEVLVIDDFSQDETFAAGLPYEKASSDFRITMLRTPGISPLCKSRYKSRRFSSSSLSD